MRLEIAQLKMELATAQVVYQARPSLTLQKSERGSARPSLTFLGGERWYRLEAIWD